LRCVIDLKVELVWVVVREGEMEFLKYLRVYVSCDLRHAWVEIYEFVWNDLMREYVYVVDKWDGRDVVV
ncbi:hypothetical protein, partial [Staphylococcus pettenkoferi]|uniref:hypothetical protein n=1 Tax=Staphylococcus pettenkoferi TaxID=170573 RepID=UPI001C92DF19